MELGRFLSFIIPANNFRKSLASLDLDLGRGLIV
jgi:hypothetical protein